MLINDEVKGLVEKLAHSFKIPQFIHNNFNDYVPGETPIYYSGPYWDNEEVIAAITTFLSGNWVTAGENVREFELNFSKKFNFNYSVMVNSGSSANLVLISSLKKCLKWKDGNEIILSVVGFPTTLAPIIQNNLSPVFVDIELNTLNFDIDLIEEKISSRTKAIFISPVLGNSPNMDELTEIATKYNLELILDNCDSLGSKWKGKYLSEYCIASTCSFYPAHHICTGEGGMVSSNNKEIIRTAQSIAWWGRDCYCVGAANLLSNGTCKKRFDNHIADLDIKIDHKYVFTNIGYNLKPLDLQGAIGNIQLKKFDEIHRKRKQSKGRNQSLFEKYINDITIPDEPEFADTSWFGTPIICKTKEIKESLALFLEKNKIQTRNYFAGNILIHPAYREYGDSSKYPNANEVLFKVFFIGAAPHYNEAIFAYIEEVLEEWRS